MAKLVCIAGMNKGDEFPLPEGTTTIGRDRTCDIILYDKKCSRVHCQVHCKGKFYAVEDLNSRNGTFLNRKKITKRRDLQEGDRIHLGSTTLELSEKPIGDLLDQTAAEVAAELADQEFGKVFKNAAVEAVRSRVESKKATKARGFFAVLRRKLGRKKGEHPES